MKDFATLSLYPTHQEAAARAPAQPAPTVTSPFGMHSGPLPFHGGRGWPPLVVPPSFSPPSYQGHPSCYRLG